MMPNSAVPIEAVVCDFANVVLLPAATRPASFDAYFDTLAARGPMQLLDHFTLNEPLLDALRSVSERLPVHLFTGGHIHELPEVVPHLARTFSGQFSPRQIPYSKSDPQAYRKLAVLARLLPETTLFIDDTASNIQAARSAGFQTHLYTTNQAILPVLDSISRQA